MLAFFSLATTILLAVSRSCVTNEKSRTVFAMRLLTGGLKESWKDQAAGCKTLRSPISSSIVMLRF